MMFGKKRIIGLILVASTLGLPAFGQREVDRSDLAVQALGSFVQSTSGDGVTHSATNSGGVLGTYRHYLGGHSGFEIDYAYTLNPQQYAQAGNISSISAYSHEATGAYVWRLPLHRLTPFALAGAGTLIFDSKGFDGDAQVRPVAVYGAGADFDLGSRWFLRAQYRGLIYNSPTLALSAISAELLTHRAEPSVGFGYRF
jgi:opacity protein-like surface antigen